jgi:DNA-binding beta-propeller fold protein YncE
MLTGVAACQRLYGMVLLAVCAQSQAFAPRGVNVNVGETGDHKAGILPIENGQEVLVADSYNDRVAVYSDQSLIYQGEWTGITTPTGLVRKPGTAGVFVSGFRDVYQVDPATGTGTGMGVSKWCSCIAAASDAFYGACIQDSTAIDSPSLLFHWGYSFSSSTQLQAGDSFSPIGVLLINETAMCLSLSPVRTVWLHSPTMAPS